MTISNTTNSVTVNGNDLTTTFSYDFYMGGAANYASLVYIDDEGTETAIATSSFSITGVTNSDGGTFTYPLSGSPIATSTSLRLSRILPLVQNVAIGNQGNFYPSAVEQGLDYLTMVAQQQGVINSLSPETLFGNPTTASAAGTVISLGSGLSFSGNSLVVSGVSGSGTVTQVNTGEGLTGGPVTGVGTISFSTITTGYILANFSGSADEPRGVQLLSAQQLAVTSSTSSVTIPAPSLVRINTVTTSIVTASFTFSSITTSYTHLEMVISGRGTSTSADVNIALRFNDDASSLYDYQQTFGGASVSVVQQNLQAQMLTLAIPAAGSTASMAGGCSLTVYDYKGTTFFKTVSGIGAENRTGSGQRVIASGGQWRSTSAITSITVFPDTGSFATGSMATLYGRI